MKTTHYFSICTIAVLLAMFALSCDSVLSPETASTERTTYQTFSMMQSRQQPGQASWQPQESGTDAHLKDVHFVDAQTGWAVGSENIIIHTSDGGQTWQTDEIETEESVRDRNLIDVHFVDAQNGWAVMQTSGDFSGAPGWSHRLYHTSNGGATWQFQLVHHRLNSVYFADVNNGWVSGSAFRGPELISGTTDGGNSWSIQYQAEQGRTIRSLFFTDSQTGWAFEAGNLIGTTNSQHWNQLSTSSGFSMYFTDPQNGWITGSSGTIRHSTDGGHTWQEQDSGTDALLRDVHFADKQTGWALGDGGVILHTIDGGQTWNQQDSGTDVLLRSLYFVNTQEGPRGWAVGENGTILHYRVEKTEPDPDSETLTIYDDELQSPWINASWNTSIDFANIEQVRSGSQSIRVEQGAWGALSLRSGQWGSPIDIEPGWFKAVEFALYPEEPVVIDLQLENDQGDSFPRVRYGTVEAGQWTPVSVAIAKLNPGGQTVHRINILESSGQAKTYFVDSWELTGDAAPKDPAPDPEPDPEPEDPETLTVYAEGLAHPWMDASWSASVDFDNTEQVFTGTRSIRVEQNAWGAISVRSGQWGSPQNISLGQYEQVELAIYAEESATLDLLLENDEGDEFPRVRYGTVEAGNWTVVTLSLAELNPDGHAWNRIDIAESSGTGKTYFVDDLKLVGGSGGEAMAAN